MKTQKKSLSGFFSRILKNKRSRNKNMMKDFRKFIGGKKRTTQKKNRKSRKY